MNRHSDPPAKQRACPRHPLSVGGDFRAIWNLLLGVRLVLPLLFGPLGLLLACNDGPTPTAEKSPDAARRVTLVPVEERPVERTIEVSGTLTAYEQVRVAVKVSGRLASVAVDLASAVKAGDTLAQIETVDYQLRVEQAAAAVAQARAQLGLPADTNSDDVDIESTAVVRQAQATRAEAEATLNRTRALARDGLATAADLDNAQAAFLRAESALQSARDEVRLRQASLRQRHSELRLARQQLSDTVIRAPIDGIIQQRLVNAGEFLAAGAPVVELVRVDVLRLKLVIPERDAASVQQDQAVQVVLDGDAKTHSGRIARLAPALDAQSRTLLVEADIPNPGTLRPGVLARASIVTGSSPAVTVPSSAVVAFAGVEKVLTVAEGKAVEKRVKTGKRLGDRTEILSGVAVGDQVVQSPGALQQGQAVTTGN